ncbi:hypothetical protein MASR2M70_05690 [Bacillota bacterium]
MLKKIGKILLALTIVILIMPFLAVEAEAGGTGQPAELAKAEAIATYTGNTGEGIKVTTANIFMAGNYYGGTRVPLEFSGIYDNNNYFIKVNGNNAYINQETNSSGYATVSIDNPVLGNYGLTIQITDTSNNIVYDSVTLSTYITDSFPMGLGELNPKPEIINKLTDSFNVNVKLPFEYNTDNVDVKLLKNDEVLAVSNLVQNKPYSYSDYIDDTRYNGIFTTSAASQIRYEAKSLGSYLYTGKPLEAGMYDLGVFNMAGILQYRVTGAAEVITLPYITVSGYISDFPHIAPGAEKVYAALYVEGGDIRDYDLELYDGENRRIAKSNKKYRVTNAYGNNTNAVYELTLDQGRQIEEKKYFFRIVSDSGEQSFRTNDSNAINAYTSNRANINRIILPNSKYANFFAFADNTVPDGQYKAILKKDNGLVVEKLVTPNGNIFDVEFTDAEGNVLLLQNETNYEFRIDEKSSYGWDYCGSDSFWVSYPEEDSSGTDTPFYGYPSFENGKFQVYMRANSTIADPLIDAAKFEVVASNVAGGDYTYNGFAMTRETYGDGTKAIWLNTSVNAAMPMGYYTLKAYYDGAEIANNNLNILDRDYYTLYSDRPSHNYYSGYYNDLDGIESFEYNNISPAAGSGLKLYKQDNLTVEHDYYLPLIKQGDRFEIKSVNTGNLDLLQKYEWTLDIDGKPMFNSWRSEYLFPVDVQADSTVYSVSLTQGEGGTIASSVASGKKGTEVYIANTPNEGFQFKPGSLRVNGKSVLGRSFVISGNAAVSAEFEPVFVPKYTVEVSPHIWNGSLSIDKETAAEGETVTVQVAPNEDYELRELRHRNKNFSNYTDIDVNTKTFTMPGENIVIEASFTYSPKQTYWIGTSYGSGSKGSISYSGGGAAKEGSLVTVTVTPNAGYRLKEGSLYYKNGGFGDPISGDPVPIVNNSFVMPGNSITVYVEFIEADMYQISLDSRVIGGHILPALPLRTAAGAAINVTPVPLPGYKYVEGTLKFIDGAGRETPIINGSFVMPEGDITLYAEFEEVLYTVTVAQTVNGTVTPSKASARVGEWVSLNILPADGYRLKAGSLMANGVLIPPAPVDLGIGLHMPDADVTITAEFETMPKSYFRNSRLNVSETMWPLNLIINEEMAQDVLLLNQGNLYASITITDDKGQIVLENLKSRINNPEWLDLYKTRAISAGNYSARVKIGDYTGEVDLGELDLTFGDYLLIEDVYSPKYFAGLPTGTSLTTDTRKLSVEVRLEHLFTDLDNLTASFVEKGSGTVIAQAKNKGYRHYADKNSDVAGVGNGSNTTAIFFDFEFNAALNPLKEYEISFNYRKGIVMSPYAGGGNLFTVNSQPRVFRGIMEENQILLETECIPPGTYAVNYNSGADSRAYNLVIDGQGNGTIDISASPINDNWANFSFSLDENVIQFHAAGSSEYKYPSIIIDNAIDYNAMDHGSGQWYPKALPISSSISFELIDYTGSGRVELHSIQNNAQGWQYVQSINTADLVGDKGSFTPAGGLNPQSVYELRLYDHLEIMMQSLRLKMTDMPSISANTWIADAFFGNTLTINHRGMINISDPENKLFFFTEDMSAMPTVIDFPMISIDNKTIKLDMTNAPEGIFTVRADYKNGDAYLPVLTPDVMRFYKVMNESSPVITGTRFVEGSCYAEGVNLDAAYSAKVKLFEISGDRLLDLKVQKDLIKTGRGLEAPNSIFAGLPGGSYKLFYIIDGKDRAVQNVSYSQAEIAKYTVTFNSNGGTAVAGIADVLEGDIIAQPPVPRKEGVGFGGWYKDAALTLKWDFARDRVTENLTLHAKWEANAYTVVFKDFDGRIIKTESVAHGGTATAPTAPIRDGYIFTGWNRTLNNITANTTITALYTLGRVNVSFHSMGGSRVSDLSNIDRGSKISAPSVPVRDGFDFGGWYKEYSLINPWDFQVDKVEGNTTLYAKWIGKTYALTIDNTITGGTISGSKSQAKAGDIIEITIEPGLGNSLKDLWWSAAGSPAAQIVTIQGNKAAFVMPARDVTISALFNEAVLLSINVNKAVSPYSVSVYGYDPYFNDYRNVAGGTLSSGFTLPKSSGDYYVSVSMGENEGWYWEQKAVKLTQNETVSFAVPTTYSVSGKVNVTGGMPGDLYVYISSENDYKSSHVAADGSYTVHGVKAGNHTVRVSDWNNKYTGSKEKSISISDANVSDVNFDLIKGADLRINLIKNGGTPAFKAYLSLYKRNGEAWDFMSSAAGGGTGTIAFDGGLTGPGDYKVEISYLQNKNYTSPPYVSSPVEFNVVVDDLATGTVGKDLVYADPTDGAAALTGDGNMVITDLKNVQKGDYINLEIRYKNNGNQNITPEFSALLPSGLSLAAGVTGNSASHQASLSPGQSGKYKVIIKVGEISEESLDIKVKVKLGDTDYDFGSANIVITKATLNAPMAVKTGEAFKVYGEATEGSTVRIKDGVTGQVFATVSPKGKFYTAEISLPEGTTQLLAEAALANTVALSKPIEITAKSLPIAISAVKKDDMNLQLNSRLGIYAFSQYVDMDLMGRSFRLKTEFENQAEISKVVYHFAGMDFPANANFEATFSGWGGAGLKALTATVTSSAGKEILFNVAEVTILIDPSGVITNAADNKPLGGVSVICWYLDETDPANHKWISWNAEDYGQINPQISDENGRYGWMVPEGKYRVTATLDGFEDYDTMMDVKFSDGANSTILVPPARDDVNFAMRPKTYNIAVGEVTGGGDISASQTARYTDKVNITVLPEAGKQLKSLSVNNQPINLSELSFEMPAEDVLISAEFEAKAGGASGKFDVTLSAGGTAAIDIVVGDMENLNGEEVNIVYALYKGGRMVGISVSAITLSDTGFSDTATVSFNSAIQPDACKVFVLKKSDRAPLATNLTKPL